MTSIKSSAPITSVTTPSNGAWGPGFSRSWLRPAESGVKPSNHSLSNRRDGAFCPHLDKSLPWVPTGGGQILLHNLHVVVSGQCLSLAAAGSQVKGSWSSLKTMLDLKKSWNIYTNDHNDVIIYNHHLTKESGDQPQATRTSTASFMREYHHRCQLHEPSTQRSTPNTLSSNSVSTHTRSLAHPCRQHVTRTLPMSKNNPVIAASDPNCNPILLRLDSTIQTMLLLSPTLLSPHLPTTLLLLLLL